VSPWEDVKLDAGTLILKLRMQRKLTQSGLASRAGVSLSTVQRVESDPKAPIRRTTAAALLGALASASPLTPAEEQAFFASTGTSRLVDIARDLADHFGIVPATASSLARPASIAHQIVDDLIGACGEDRVVALLASIRSVIDPRAARGPAPLVVAHPPKIEDGHVVHEFVPYGPDGKPLTPPGTKPASIAKPNKRRAGA
jgi:transcriptional regulator with XRE-family HTH domain